MAKFMVLYTRYGKEHLHDYEPNDRDEALRVGDELTRDGVADFFRVVRCTETEVRPIAIIKSSYTEDGLRVMMKEVPDALKVGDGVLAHYPDDPPPAPSKYGRARMYVKAILNSNKLLLTSSKP